MSNAIAKLFSLTAAVILAAVIVSSARAEGPDISAHRLLDSWKDDDPGMRMAAEAIASAFASGFSWGGQSGGSLLCATRP